MGMIANFDDFEDQIIKKSDLKDEDQIVISEINFKIIFMGILFSFSMYFDRNPFFRGKNVQQIMNLCLHEFQIIAHLFGQKKMLPFYKDIPNLGLFFQS